MPSRDDAFVIVFPVRKPVKTRIMPLPIRAFDEAYELERRGD